METFTALDTKEEGRVRLNANFAEAVAADATNAAAAAAALAAANAAQTTATAAQPKTGTLALAGFSGITGTLPAVNVADLSATYLTVASASSTYLTTITAASTYQPLSASLTTIAGNGSAFYLSADNHTSGTTNKVFTATEQTKLSGIATGATANSADATLLARANHTGTQAASTITGVLPVANGGTGTATPGLVQGTNITITGTWPNQTITASGGGGSYDPAAVAITGGTINGATIGATTAAAVRTTALSSTGNTIAFTVHNSANITTLDTTFNLNGGTGTFSGGLALSSGVIVITTARAGGFGTDAWLKLNGSGSAGGLIQFAQATALGTPDSNCARIGAKDVAGTAEVFVRDEAGNETQISPHAADAPASLYDDDEPFPQVTREANYYLGLVRYVNVTRQREGRADWEHIETFAAHNTRLGLTGERALVVLDWDTVQQALVSAREQERAEWQQKKTQYEARYPELLSNWQARRDAAAAAEPPIEFTEEEPSSEYEVLEPVTITAKPKPAWLVAAATRKTAYTSRKNAEDSARPALLAAIKSDFTRMGLTVNSLRDAKAQFGAYVQARQAKVVAANTTALYVAESKLQSAEMDRVIQALVMGIV